MMQQATEGSKRALRNSHRRQVAEARGRKKLTAQDLFANLEGIQDGRGDARHGPDHAAQAQIDEHEEEHDRPEWRSREMCHSLRESDESQTGALNSLHKDGQEDESKSEPATDAHADQFWLTLLSSSSRMQGSRPSWEKLPSFTVLMT